MIQEGQIVLITKGALAGKNGVVLKCLPNGHKNDSAPYYRVLGLESCPRKVKKGDLEALKKELLQLKPFVKTKSLCCLFPTRYFIKLDLDTALQKEVEGAEKKELLKTAKKRLIKKYVEERSPDAAFKFFYEKFRIIEH